MCCTVYCLRGSESGRTYVGATVNFARRLRQHNGELVGGAKFTKRRKEGERWEPLVVVRDVPTWTLALQVEWAWKYVTRRHFHGQGKVGAHKRVLALHRLLHEMPRATSKAVPYAEWGSAPRVVFWRPEDAAAFAGPFEMVVADACPPEAARSSAGATRSPRGERKGLPQGDQPREAGEEEEEGEGEEEGEEEGEGEEAVEGPLP